MDGKVWKVVFSYGFLINSGCCSYAVYMAENYSNMP